MTDKTERSSKTIPNLPAHNPWLTESVCPVSGMTSGGMDSALIAGPTGGKKLDHDQVKAVPALFVSSPTIKKAGTDTVVLAPGTLGIQKILATGGAFELVGFLPYPGFEERARQTDELAIAATLREVDAARRANDDAQLAAIPESLAKLGLDFNAGVNGAYNLIDKDGFHYCVYDAVKILKITDDNKARAPMRPVRSINVAEALPRDIARSVTRIIGIAMTYDGFIVVASPGALVVLNRDLGIQSSVTFRGETVDNGIVVDEKNGIYVVTSERMMKLVWNGTRLSTDPRDGAWESPYNTLSDEKAQELGARVRGAGTPPTLMGFGDDPDKLVVIADADESGTHAVAFWRDAIPADFKQRTGTKSRRIADQIRIDISRLTIEPPPEVLGYGVAFFNSTYPNPAKIPGIGNAFVSGVTRPAPMGIQKFNWNPIKRAFEKAWINYEIDNTDWMVPSISTLTGEMYVAHKEHGNYVYVGLDWETGKMRDRWAFPDDSRAWNAFGGITTILENGDLMIGGVFALKRLRVGEDKAAA